MDELVGKAKRAVGKLTDNDSSPAEGEDHEFHGRAEQAAADGHDELGNRTRIQGDDTQ